MSETNAGKEKVSNTGTLLAVVGASGVGKDSLIDHARRELSGDGSVLFVRRVVTRPALAAAEDHDYLAPEEFAAALAAGRFAVYWDAHGLRYGIPASVRDHLAGGGTAVLNGSRAALPAIRAAFERLLVIHITARPEIIAERLANRGRENEADLKLRMRRGAIALPDCVERIDIDNSGPFEVAGAAFLDVIQNAACGIAASSARHSPVSASRKRQR